MGGLYNRIIGFARELYRRRVPRVVVAYAIAGAAAVNLTDILRDVFPDLPGYTLQLVVALLIVGFPVSVALAWALDITSRGIVRTPAEPDRRPRLVEKPSQRRNIATVAMALALLLLAVVTVLRFRGHDRSSQPDQTVAVIPTVTGVDQPEALEDALATLLATRLESAGWSTVPADEMRDELRLPFAPGAHADRVGAGFFVDVRLDVDGETADVRATLFAVGNPQDTLSTGGQPGLLSEALELVDRAAAQLTGYTHGLLAPFPSRPAAGSVAVMPVEVAGPEEYEYLREAIPVLLAAKLEQAGWPASDNGVVTGVMSQPGVSGSRNPYVQAARRVNASFFVETRVEILDAAAARSGWRWPWKAKPEIRIESRLFQTETHPRVVDDAAQEGRMSDLTRLVAGVAAELTRGMDIEQRAAPLAADAPTGSLEAIEAFIEGERQFRVGEYEQAAAAFASAVEADGDFALAYYRLSIAAEWAGDVADYNPWKESGVRLAIMTDRCGRQPRDDGEPGARSCLPTDRSRRLTWRTRLLAEARRTQLGGNIAAAERLYDWIRVAYPDDYEATFQLAEILFHNAPLEGRDPLDSDSLWQRVLLFQSNDFGALLHAARLKALDHSLSELASVAASALDGEADPVRRLEMDSYVAFAGEDPALVDRALRTLASHEPRAIWSIGGRVAMYTRNLAGAERIVRLLTDPSRTAGTRVLGHITLAHLLMAQGRWQSARRELATARDLDPLASLIFDVSLLVAPFAPEPSRAELEALRERLLAQRPRPPGSDAITELTVHDSVYDRLRLFALGAVSLRLGVESEANRYMDELGKLPGLEDARALGDELARSLLIQSAVTKGNFLAAEQESEKLSIRTAASKLMLSPFFALTRERFQKARVLAERGRTDEALQLFSSFSAVSVYDLAYLAPAHLERARLLDSQGDEWAAASEYQRVIELWQDPDPELLPHVERARERLLAIGMAN